MSAFQSLVMGFVSGIAEMLPISADAHRLILRSLFGIPSEDALFRLLCHIASLLMLLWVFQSDLRHLKRTSRLMQVPPRRRRQKLDLVSSYTVRLLRIAVISMVICRVLLWKTDFIRSRPAYMTMMLGVNGLILLIPSLIRGGNMDSRNMPKITGVMMGIASGLAGIPGISHVGAVTSFGVSSGVERNYALRFAYILLIPGLIADAVLDIVAIIGGGMAAFNGKGMVFSLLGACLCAYATSLGVRLMRWVSDRGSLEVFAYYCWGAALLTFILFLIV